MSSRTQRLGRLLRLQKQIKSLHETKQAMHIADAAAADREASELLEALNAASPIPGLFPELYNQRIGRAMGRRDTSAARAEQEAKHAASATMRSNMVTRAYEEAQRFDERATAEKEQAEAVERRVGKGNGPGKSK